MDSFVKDDRDARGKRVEYSYNGEAKVLFNPERVSIVVWVCVVTYL